MKKQELTLDGMKTEAKEYLDWLIEKYLEYSKEQPNEKERHALYGRISFARIVGLISWEEAISQLRNIGLNKLADLYEQQAKVEEEKSHSEHVQSGTEATKGQEEAEKAEWMEGQAQ